jgi:hypothetical protein
MNNRFLAVLFLSACAFAQSQQPPTTPVSIIVTEQPGVPVALGVELANPETRYRPFDVTVKNISTKSITGVWLSTITALSKACYSASDVSGYSVDNRWVALASGSLWWWVNAGTVVPIESAKEFAEWQGGCGPASQGRMIMPLQPVPLELEPQASGKLSNPGLEPGGTAWGLGVFQVLRHGWPSRTMAAEGCFARAQMVIQKVDFADGTSWTRSVPEKLGFFDGDEADQGQLRHFSDKCREWSLNNATEVPKPWLLPSGRFAYKRSAEPEPIVGTEYKFLCTAQGEYDLSCQENKNP